MSKNESLLQRRQAAVARGVSQIHPIVAERAENATVWDVDGRCYLDLVGGIAVTSLGHAHPAVVEVGVIELDARKHV